MSKLLRVDASPRIEGSHSRELADFFTQNWLGKHSKNEVIVRDLGRDGVPHLTAQAVAGFFTPVEELSEQQQQAIALSDELVSELMTADALLIDTPMYNFSIPSVLKAWIDQIVRVGKTFDYSPDTGFEGLIKGKPAYVITATGASFSEENMKAFDFMTPYLTTLLGFLGFTDIRFFSLEGTTTDESMLANSRETAQQQITAIGAPA